MKMLRMSVKISTAIAFFLVLFLCPALAQVNPDGTVDTGDDHTRDSLLTSESPKAIARRLHWWSEDRFGMFIHWGLYAQDGCFWKGQDGKTEHMMRHLQIPVKEYEKIATEFNPVRFNAEEWVLVAKKAGMKYMVITTKHHDGFAMFQSPSNNYNIMQRTRWKHDPVRELANACKKHGLRFGVYYSLGRDWHDPDVPTSVKADGNRRSNTWDFPDEDKKDFSKYFERKVKPQVRELLMQYDPAIMWFDTPEQITPAQSKELLQLIRKLKPNCIVNQRVGNRLGDYAVREQEVPKVGEAQPWETCMTLNRHWGYKKDDDKWKPTDTLIRHLIDIISKGGNFLLNVGPTGAGIIPVPSVERLQQVGAWMAINKEAVYGTTGSPFKKQPIWGRCTQKVKGNTTTLYLHVINWPVEGKLVVPGLQNKIKKAYLLTAASKKLPATVGAEGVTIQVPASAPGLFSTTIVLIIDTPLQIQSQM
jgi:alpha-L-fucosidase